MSTPAAAVEEDDDEEVDASGVEPKDIELVCTQASGKGQMAAALETGGVVGKQIRSSDTRGARGTWV